MLKILRLAIYCVASECLVTTNSGWWPPLICVDPRHSVAWMNASLPHLPPWPYFFAAHIEITNHVVLGLPSLIHHHHLCVSLIWSPSVSEGRQGACWSGHDPEQPERPHGDPEHLPTAEEPQRTGEKPVWAWHSLEKLYFHILPYKFKSSESSNKPFDMEFNKFYLNLNMAKAKLIML